MQVKDPAHVADSEHSSQDDLQGRALQVQSILPHSLFNNDALREVPALRIGGQRYQDSRIAPHSPDALKPSQTAPDINGLRTQLMWRGIEILVSNSRNSYHRDGLKLA
jgi:hypothetical protein